MKETGLTGKRRSTTIAATPDDGKSQRKRRRRTRIVTSVCHVAYWQQLAPFVTGNILQTRAVLRLVIIMAEMAVV